ncbi:MAG TPA: hypothetical protein ENN51_06890 [candidate division WOR-3 bacterium]|uniref:Alginate export domain-containing protein n=1 Tax=candidate division WOR-3 bacterium TaxID=2052148 RepID=A0A7V0T708_UNCW3|nr:hypothetical protein [candidate division WOR-3 bacterium]
MASSLLLALLVAAGGFRADLTSRLNLRWAEPDSVRLSWFQTRAALVFEPLRADRVESRVGVGLRFDAFPALASALEPGAADIEPVELLLDEAYVRLFDLVPGMNLGLGRQFVHWGAADAVNPTNWLCPPDYSDPLAWDARRPSWLAHLEYTPVSAFGLELAWRPVFSPALTSTGGWFPVAGFLPTEEQLRSGLVQRFIEQGVPPDSAAAWADRYSVTIGEDSRLPGRALSDGSWGGRLKSRLGVFDISAGMLRGYDFLPAATPVTTVRPETQELDFSLVTRYPRATFFGADFATDLFGVGLWVEGAWTRYDDSLPGDRLDIIGGADYTLAGIYANLQYLRGRFPLALARASGETSGDYLLGAVERRFLGERILARLGGVVEVTDGSWGLLPLVRWSPFGGVEMELGGLLFAGEGEDAFAPLERHDEVYLGIRYRF